jgi:hypothetical protein
MRAPLPEGETHALARPRKLGAMVNRAAASAGRPASFAGIQAKAVFHRVVFIAFFLVSGVARRLLRPGGSLARALGDEWISRPTPYSS